MCSVAIDPILSALLDAFWASTATTREPSWLTERRTTGMNAFVALGLPTRDDEGWRFTDLRPLISAKGLPAPAVDGIADHALIGANRLQGEAHRLVLVNGSVVPDLSGIGNLPAGVWFASMADTIDLRPDLIRAAFDVSDTFGGQPLASFNAALFADGFVLAIDPGVTVPCPFEILHVGDADSSQAYHMRNVILAGAGSQAGIVETYVGNGPGWTNGVTTVDVAAGATLHHAKIQAEGADSIHLAVTRARLAEASVYDAFSLICGARLSRQDIQVSMAGKSANMVLNGAYLLREQQEATIAPVVDHLTTGCQTNELLKGVLAGHAHGVFQGTLVVRPGADFTDAHQLNRNLMMSRTSRIDTKPELKIDADEVKCSHGATVGDLDDAALFYLLARGIDPQTARHMLVEAFVADVFDVAALAPDIDAHARRYMRAWMDQGGAT